MTHSIDELNERGIFQWESVSDSFDDANLFLGNGFSIALCNRLSYKSLYERFKQNIGKELVALFDKFKTHNFEFIMQTLKNAEIVNKILEENTEKIEPLQIKLREGLIRTVQENHPSHSEIYYPQLFELGREMLEFKDIFTTNYDVYLYKAVLQMISEFKEHKLDPPYQDYFYESVNPTELKFSGAKAYDTRSIYYLHGALFIYAYKNRGSNYKLRRLEELRLEYLQLIRREIENNNFPIFVAEGNSEDKLSTIHNNFYLNFCASELQKSKRNLVFYGFSFGESDKHIVNFIEKTKIEKIAISIYKGDKSLDELERESSFFKTLFTKKEVAVYDSDSLFYSLRPF